ncbi:MAG: hypothetical protein HY560_01305 [Gemmatimonadetes bacterium]|nr:hypothetical protein [Gemmatimonadota bacterium]
MTPSTLELDTRVVAAPAPYVPSGPGGPLSRILARVDGPVTVSAVQAVRRELRRASPWTLGQVKALVELGRIPARWVVALVPARRPGHPVWRGPGSPTRSREVRSGLPCRI